MPYFSRLTDIVTCNLSSILSKSPEPAKTLEEIIGEMEQGVAGANRSVKSAGDNVARIEAEIAEQGKLVNTWLSEARDAILANREEQARQAITRKQEVQDLIAGLEQQLEAAVSTRDHLRTMLNALEARLADARRRRASGDFLASSSEDSSASLTVDSERNSRVDAELDELRRQVGM